MTTNQQRQWLAIFGILTLSFFQSLAISAATSPPPTHVVERRLPNGDSELQLVDAQGIALPPFTLNLSTHHSPATSADDPLMTKWRAWRYGGFVCFNDNQFVGSEYSKNQDPQLFNPSKLDIAGWAATLKSAGMHYAVLTTRHTSGFLLWDSATTEFDVASSPCRTDVAGEFVKECRRHGIAPGFYYCLWGGPKWMPHANARALILAQLHELATRYGAIPYFWIDMFNWAPADLTPQEAYDLLKNINPNAVVILNQHIQDGSKIAYFPTDVLNGEVHLPPAGGHQPLRTVNDKQYYLPFEFEPVSQRIAKGTTTPWGQVGAWFTVRDSEPFPAIQLLDWIQQAVALGAANVLLSCARTTPASSAKPMPASSTNSARCCVPPVSCRYPGAPVNCHSFESVRLQSSDNGKPVPIELIVAPIRRQWPCNAMVRSSDCTRKDWTSTNAYTPPSGRGWRK